MNESTYLHFAIDLVPLSLHKPSLERACAMSMSYDIDAP